MKFNDIKSGTNINKWEFWSKVYTKTGDVYSDLDAFVHAVFGNTVKSKSDVKKAERGVESKYPVFMPDGSQIGTVSHSVPLVISSPEIKEIDYKKKRVQCVYCEFPGKKDPFGGRLGGLFRLQDIEAYYINKNVEKIIGGVVTLDDSNLKPNTAEKEALTALGTCFYVYLRYKNVNWKDDEQYTNAFVQYINCIKENVSSYEIEGVKIDISLVNSGVGNVENYIPSFKSKTFEKKWYTTSVLTGKFLYDKVLKNILRTSVQFGGSFQIYMRESFAIKEYIFKKLNPILSKLIVPMGGDKWNPADMWIKTGKGIKVLSDYIDEVKKEDILDNEKIIKINYKMLDLYSGIGNNKLIPVSLKKLGDNVNVKVINDNREFSTRDPDQMLDLDVEYKGIRVRGDVNLYIDMTATYKIGTKVIKDDIQVVARPFNNDRAQLQVEKVVGASAVFGKIGSGPSQTLIQLNDSTAIRRMNAYRKKFEMNLAKELKEKYNVTKKILLKPGAKPGDWIISGGSAQTTDTKNIRNQIRKLIREQNPKIDGKTLEERTENLFTKIANEYIKSIFRQVGVDVQQPGRVEARMQSSEYAYVINSSKKNRDGICEAIYRYGTSQGVAIIKRDSKKRKLIQKLTESSIHIIVY